jgi:hypothetical protein
MAMLTYTNPLQPSAFQKLSGKLGEQSSQMAQNHPPTVRNTGAGQTQTPIYVKNID